MPTDLDRLKRALGDRYAVQEEIGRGGWATVYLARDLKHGRAVAVKAFRSELALSLGTERFLREIRLAAGFQHPHIVPLYDSGGAEDVLFYVMPFVDGETLRDRLAREGPMEVAEAVAVARDVAGALAYAHDHGVLHRDIKPENILLSGGHAVVADFGIARAVTAAREERLSQPGIAVGSPAYMSPEQALGAVDSDERADVYSLACVTYEMLAGTPPFARASALDVAARYEGAGPPPLAARRPDVPAEVEAALSRALAIRPDDRFDGARAFAVALAPGQFTPAALPRRRAARRRARLAAAGLALAALVGGVLWRSHATPTGPATSPTVVAVFPFSAAGAPGQRYLSEGMVDLLSAGLDGAGELRAVDPHAVLGSLAASGTRDSARAPLAGEAARTAARLGAGLFVLGSITESAGRLRVSASLYGPGGPVARASAEGDTTRLFEIVDRITADLVTGRGGEPATRLTRLAARTTASLPALKAYLEGEGLLRQGRTGPALDAFTRATVADSSFAVAHYRRAVAADWNASFDVAREAAEQAVRDSARLTPSMRTMLQAYLAWHRGDALTAERLYRAELVDHPDDVEAWYQLGEVLYHSGALRGRSFTASRPAFERALFFDPQYSDAAFHLLDTDAIEGRAAAFDSLLATVHAPSALLLRRRAVRAAQRGTAAERALVVAELANEGEGTVIVAASGVAAYAHDLVAAGHMARLLTLPARPAETRAYGHLFLAQLSLARGRAGDAAAEVRAAAALAPDAAIEAEALAATLPWIPVAPPELARLRGALDAWDATQVPPALNPSPAFHAHDGVHGAVKRYLIAQLSARLGDGDRARREADALQATTAGADVGTLAADLAAGVRARLAANAGRPAEALAILDSMALVVPLDRVANSPVFGHAAERFLRAELLHGAGRDAQAQGFYASLGESRIDLPYYVPAQLRLAEIAERRGDVIAAGAAYRRVLALWSACDAALAPALGRARDGLARVERGR